MKSELLDPSACTDGECGEFLSSTTVHKPF
jgi:hypothetical protein